MAKRENTDKATDETPDEQQAPDAPTEPQEPVQEPANSTPEEEPDEADDNTSKAGKEAAKYRVRLRETEAERDTLTAKVEQLQRGMIESLAANEGRLSSPEIIWASGTEIADLLDDDGNIDTGKVNDAVEATVGKYGIPRRPRPNPAQREQSTSPPKITGTQGMINAISNRG